nr:MAG TPA: Toxin Ibs, type I toxin-antitoxin system [Caudoviricetes sp.]
MDKHRSCVTNGDTRKAYTCMMEQLILLPFLLLLIMSVQAFGHQ